MAIADKLTKLQSDISDAYTTIATKGGTVPTDKNTDNLPDAIDSIPSGSGPTPTGDFRVRFIDIDGTLLKEEWVNKGGNATPPANPTFDSTYLTFAKWNIPYTNVQDDIDIGAVYDTLNNDIYIYYQLIDEKEARKTATIKYYSDNAGTIDWGDGTIDTISVASSSAATVTHTYSGDVGTTYIIKISASNFIFNQTSTSDAFMGSSDARDCVKRIYMGTKYKQAIGVNWLYALYHLEVLSLRKNHQTNQYWLGNYMFQSLLNLKSFILPETVSTNAAAFLSNFTQCKYFCMKSTSQSPNITTSSAEYIPNLCYATTFNSNSSLNTNSRLKELNLKNISTIQNTGNFFQNCTSLEEIYFEKITGINGYFKSSFGNCYNLKAIILNTNSLVTLAADPSAYYTLNVWERSKVRFYVPDSLYQSYLVADNWSDISYMIKPMSQLPTTSYFYKYVKSQINNS